MGEQAVLGGNQGFAVSHLRFEVPAGPLRGDGGEQVARMS